MFTILFNIITVPDFIVGFSTYLLYLFRLLQSLLQFILEVLVLFVPELLKGWVNLFSKLVAKFKKKILVKDMTLLEMDIIF